MKLSLAPWQVRIINATIGRGVLRFRRWRSHRARTVVNKQPRFILEIYEPCPVQPPVVTGRKGNCIKTFESKAPFASFSVGDYLYTCHWEGEFFDALRVKYVEHIVFQFPFQKWPVHQTLLYVERVPEPVTIREDACFKAADIARMVNPSIQPLFQSTERVPVAPGSR